MGIYGRDAKGGGDGMIMFQHQNITLINGDCMDYMASLADKAFSLAVVDPPYGIEIGRAQKGKWVTSRMPKKNWDDSPPPSEYFDVLFRVSGNQVISGGNYFNLPPTRGFVVWDKGNGFYGRDFAECEFIWTSFDVNARVFKHDPLASGDYRGKIHPTQKPVALYRWLLTNYGRPGDTILDTHLGSGSSAIAAYELGFEFIGIELDTDYYNAAVERFKKRLLQPFLPMSFNRQAKQIELKI